MVPADTSMYVPYALREQMYENHIPRSSQDEDNRCIVKNTNCPIIIDREVNIYVYIYICISCGNTLTAEYIYYFAMRINTSNSCSY